MTSTLRATLVPGDVLLLIEVSDTTVSFDRTEKCPIYPAPESPKFGW